MENKSLLAIIAVLLMGILTVMLIQLNEESPEERVASSVSDAVEDVSHQVSENLRAD